MTKVAKPGLEGMPLLKNGNRLSVQKVEAAEWNAVVEFAKHGQHGDIRDR
jgi:predicted RNA-binding protein with PUA-like domain